jgi:hypothetical protein
MLLGRMLFGFVLQSCGATLHTWGGGDGRCGSDGSPLPGGKQIGGFVGRQSGALPGPLGSDGA